MVEAVVAVIVRQAWDLGPFAGELEYLHLDTSLLEQQNTKKLYGTKNNCVHQQLGQILDPKDTKRSKYQLLLLRGLEQKLRVGCKSRVLHMTPALNST